jgi:hypothetical protein
LFLLDLAGSKPGHAKVFFLLEHTLTFTHV